MAEKEFSYDFQNDVRDLSEVFLTIVKEVPALAVLLGAPLLGPDGQALVATNKKHEWMKDVVTPKSFEVDATRNTSGATLVFTDTTGVKEGMIFGFESATGASKSVQLVVTAVNVNGTDLTVAVYGGSTDVQLVATDIANLIALPKGESTEADPDDGSEPTTEYNYVQIFDKTAKVSLTAQNVKQYGISNLLDYQVQYQLKQLAYEMGRSMIYGRRVQRTGNTGLTRGSMGGILFYMQAASGNKIDGAGAPISPSMLNDGFQLGMENGADNMRVLCCAPNQARRISAFNTAGNNPIIVRTEQVAGSFVSQFQSDIPQNGSAPTSIILVDQTFPKDKVLLLDPGRVGFVPLQNRQFQDKDATPPGADFVARRVLGEYTMEFKNAAESHILFEDVEI